MRLSAAAAATIGAWKLHLITLLDFPVRLAASNRSLPTTASTNNTLLALPLYLSLSVSLSPLFRTNHCHSFAGSILLVQQHLTAILFQCSITLLIMSHHHCDSQAVPPIQGLACCSVMKRVVSASFCCLYQLVVVLVCSFCIYCIFPGV